MTSSLKELLELARIKKVKFLSDNFFLEKTKDNLHLPHDPMVPKGGTELYYPLLSIFMFSIFHVYVLSALVGLVRDIGVVLD
jgi:hypothetical protein